MPRTWTEEQKEAARARLAAAREAKRLRLEAKKLKQTTPETNSEPVQEEPQTQPVETPQQPTPHESVDPTVAELVRMVKELQAQNQAFMAGAASTGQNSQVANGRLIGTTEKYSINKELYEDPRPRLFNENRLKRIAFDTNYELNWEQSVTSYETKDGVQTKEPKFTLQLNQIVLDDDGEPTGTRLGKAQMIFFEDPATAIVVANQYGLPVDEDNQQQFLNDMRYLRVRDWLFECFWPPKSDQIKSNKQQIVVGGQVVDSWEVSTEGNAKIPFDQLNSKLRA